MKQKPQKKSKRFQLSLFLILISFVLLFLISYKALSFQEQFLNQQNRSKTISQLDKISLEYFDKLSTSAIPAWAIPLPMEKPVFPAISFPESSNSRETLLRTALASESKLMVLTEAEINALPQDQDFWRFLLIKEYQKQNNLFQVRKVAFNILNSNFDYILPTGRTLKTEAAIDSAETFLRENNIEAFNQAMFRLRSLPVPTIIPKQSADFFSLPIPEQSQAWLDFLFFCYQRSNAVNQELGWKKDGKSLNYILKHQTGLVAFPGENLIRDLTTILASNGFSEIDEPKPIKEERNSHMLAGSNGLWVSIKENETNSIPGGFYLLLLLTSIGILGLVRFSLYEWQFIEKGKLLDEEENFFRQTAHDIKTPLTTVRFLAETISLKRYKSDEQYQKYLSQLLNESERATELIDQLLLSARLRKQSIKGDFKPVQPAFRIKDILQRLKPRLSGWEINEVFDSSEEIMADPDMLDRVIINLIENVLKHASDNRELFLKVCQHENGRTAIMVGDSGQGITVGVEQQKRIDLTRGSLPYNPSKGGSGTGLLLVRQIVRLHSGDFFSEPREDKGIWMITTWSNRTNG